MKSKNKLTLKLIRGMIIMISIISVICIIFISILIKDQMMDNYSHLAFGSAWTVAELIDGDCIDDYLEHPERDEYYMTVREQMNEISHNFDLMYCYVFVPHEDHLTYIWASDDEDVMIIGMDDVYSDGGKEISYMAFSKEPEFEMISDTDKVYGEFMVACVPIYDSSGEPVALAAADISTEKIRTAIFNAAMKIITITVIVMLVTVLIYYVYIKKNMIEPILQLNDTANGMINGFINSDIVRVDIHTNDEIEMLAHSLEKMDTDLRAYISENTRITAEKERIGAELDVATKIQANMLPSIFPPFPERNEFNLYAIMNPAKEVGGDFYDFFLIDNDHVALVMADVSGKGVPAALFMAVCKTLIKSAAKDDESPASIVSKVNERLCENNPDMMFVTVWVGIYTISSHEICYVNAGHEDPAIYRAATGHYELILEEHDMVLGFSAEAGFREHTITMSPGDRLFVYTDGVPEATSADDELFGTSRMLMSLDSSVSGSGRDTFEALREDIAAFTNGAEQFDDITMLSFEYRGDQ